VGKNCSYEHVISEKANREESEDDDRRRFSFSRAKRNNQGAAQLFTRENERSFT
jgi:hypothetical protein